MRHVVNFFISAALIWMFQLIGWLNIQSSVAPFEDVIMNQLLVSGIIGLMFTIFFWIAQFVYVLLVLASCGLGLILFPVYYGVLGYLGFRFIDVVLPGWVVVDANVWIVILMGLMLALLRWHAPSTASTTQTSSTASV